MYVKNTLQLVDVFDALTSSMPESSSYYEVYHTNVHVRNVRGQYISGEHTNTSMTRRRQQTRYGGGGGWGYVQVTRGYIYTGSLEGYNRQ